MTMKYKYHLLKYSGKQSRLTCPSCGRPHCFAPYVDDQDQIVSEEYGRCNHESSCGYFQYPPSEPNWRDYQPRHYRPAPKPKPRIITKPPLPPEPAGGICTIPIDIVRKTIRIAPPSDFLTFLRTLFDEDTINRLVQEYNIGVAKSGDAVFYQIDGQGRCRSGKVMKYDPITGHRIKDPNAKTPITWVHSLLKQQGVLPPEWELTQGLFGEHLLSKYPDKDVCLVEAEKTAIICSGFMPECIWVAVGGKTQLGDKVEVLDGRRITAFPDIDGYDKWKEKVEERPYLNIQVSDYLQKNATDEDRKAGIDIADVLIRWKTNPDANPGDENPIMQDIRKYISPQYWSEVTALIENLDLELVKITGVV